jgi:hypothetical protein
MTAIRRRKSFPAFFVVHEFIVPFFLFLGMLLSEKVEIALSVLGFQLYKTEHLVPLLLYIGCVYISVTYAFRSFERWSRFRLSQRHPIVNTFLNLLLITMPLASIIVSPVLIFPLLFVHWFSHVRSPDPLEVKGNLNFVFRRYAAVLSQMILVCWGVSVLLHTTNFGINDLFFWRWFGG